MEARLEAPPPLQPQQTETRFLPAVAEAVGRWFPELGGRSLAVSEVSVTKENVPTLPLAMTAFARSTSEQPTKNNVSIYDVVDLFIVEFWLEPARYKRANGTETPFWSYYDYEAIRDTLLENLVHWQGPNGERVAYRGMTIEAEPIAVTITFTFATQFRWCPSNKAPPPDGIVEKIAFNLCTPLNSCCPDPCPPVDPCP